MSKIRVLIADHDAAISHGLRSILAAFQDIEVVGEADDGSTAVARVQELLPDVVLIDARLPGYDGAAATRQIKHLVPGTKVLFLAMYAAYFQTGIAAGADDCLLKDCDRQELLNAVRKLANDEQAD